MQTYPGHCSLLLPIQNTETQIENMLLPRVKSMGLSTDFSGFVSGP